MRAWLYDTLVASTELKSDLGAEIITTRVIPRRSKLVVDTNTLPRPFLIYGLGNSTREGLVDSTADDPQDKDSENQFFQIWVHDEGGSFELINQIIQHVIELLHGASSAANRILTISHLETSSEFNNETYNTNFRYIRFQAKLITTGGN